MKPGGENAKPGGLRLNKLGLRMTQRQSLASTRFGALPMKSSDEKLFKPREFASLTGVTVRTLHHYDRLGLLKPARYTRTGFRLYRERDFARLEQIIALKFIGFSLKEIKSILNRTSSDLATILGRQREAIEEKRSRLDLAIRAIQRAEYLLNASNQPAWEMFAKIIEVINMQHEMDWTRKYYSEEAQQEIRERAASIPPQVIEQAQRDWAELIKEIEAAVVAGEDPASEKSQELASRWSKLLKSFTGGSQEIQAGLNRMYADRDNWPAAMPKPFSDEVQTFIVKAMTAGRTL
jgi:MerR family transcriptional regulator, thiopeptide resistance regulator